jgi:hypothetical protein
MRVAATPGLRGQCRPTGVKGEQVIAAIAATSHDITAIPWQAARTWRRSRRLGSSGGRGGRQCTPAPAIDGGRPEQRRSMATAGLEP